MKEFRKGDMTHGDITSHVVRFSIPMILANICQLTYYATDSIIVGRFLGTNAFAAVGTVTPITNIVAFIIIGICLGMTILMSEFYGAGQMDKLRREVSTSIIAGLIFTGSIIFLGIVFAPQILLLLRTPHEILPDAVLYMRVIFAGLFFTFTYNIYAATLRAMGNSKVPLYFLFISAALNIIMDLVFIIWLKWGIMGVALATITAEAISAVLCISYVYRFIPDLRIPRKEFHIDRKLLKLTISYSSVAAMQQSANHIGKMLIQGKINTLGVDAIATLNAVNRIDDFVMVPQQNIGHATTTFIAQNRGASQFSRMCKGYLAGVKVETYYSLMIISVIFLFSKPMLELFLGKDETSIIQNGTRYLHLMALFYVMPAYTNIIQAFFRGLGRMRITLNSTLVQIIGRVVGVYLLADNYGVSGVALACFFGWILMFLYEIPIFTKAWRELKNLASKENEEIRDSAKI